MKQIHRTHIVGPSRKRETTLHNEIQTIIFPVNEKKLALYGTKYFKTAETNKK